jgi:protein-tyrosine phosphatase
MTFKILVICTANICRSPVAQVILNKLLAGKNVHIQSAGTRAVDGNRADPAMQMLMHSQFPELSEQLSSHFSRALMASQISAADLVLGMEQVHLDWVNKMQPIAVGKAKLLSHWSNREPISDPVGGSQEEYQMGFNLITNECKLWAQKIQQLGLCS